MLKFNYSKNFTQGGGAKLCSPDAIEAEFEKISELEGKKIGWLQELSLQLGHSEEREHRMKASAYPFNASNQAMPYFPNVLTTNSTPTPSLPIGEGIRKTAFTLAEVLITLGIIGIVAAMTLPIVITNYKKSQTANQLKTSYSILSQAVKRSEVDNGEVKYWNFHLSSKQFFEKYLKNYIKILDEGQNGINRERIYYKWLNNETISGSWKETVSDSYLVSLQNGSLLYIHCGGEGYSTTLMVDINGYKTPNKAGIDLFHFNIIPTHGLVPWGFNTENIEDDPNTQGEASFGNTFDREILKGTGSKYACNREKWGRWCSALIMSDGWEIKNDYPW